VLLRQNDRDLENLSRTMIVVRVICAGAALSAIALLTGARVELHNALMVAGFLLLVFPLSLVWWLVFRSGSGQLHLVYAQLGADAALATGIVYCTGGANSHFALLYFVTILLASTSLSMRGALLAATGSAVLYIGASAGEYARHRAQMGPAEASAAYLALSVGLQVLFFYFVAILSGYLAQRIGIFGARLRSTARELRRVRMDTHSITESMSSGFVIVDSDYNVTEFNQSASRMLGLPVAEVIGRKAADVMAPVSPDIYGKIVAALSDGDEEERGEAVAMTRGRGEVPLGISVSLLRDDGVTAGVVLIFQDLTDVKRMTEKMRLADRLAALGELSAAVAHEIRTPLASISGSVEMLRDSLDVRGENRRLLDLVVKESDRLKCIIDHFLEFARSRPSRFTDVALNTIVAEVVQMVRNHPSFSAGTKINVVAPSQVWARVDEETIKQVFYNLALNAVEALPSGGTLGISLTASTMDGAEHAVVTFKDTGVGIGEEDLKQIFEPFFTRKKAGTGLGLAIASKIVEEHGGRIDIVSSKGSGTVATVCLPAHRSQDSRSCSGSDTADVLAEAANRAE
jgi:two-component system sensor histidine kinase PilS (NtrC family)